MLFLSFLNRFTRITVNVQDVRVFINTQADAKAREEVAPK